MPSRSSASAFDRLAPDQRAAVELVLRQGRSYGELADMLGMPEETIRARARNGLTGLAPDVLPPPRVGEIADWLLGQQSETRTRCRGEPQFACDLDGFGCGCVRAVPCAAVAVRRCPKPE